MSRSAGTVPQAVSDGRPTALAAALAASGHAVWRWDCASDRITWFADRRDLERLWKGPVPASGAAVIAASHVDDRTWLRASLRAAARSGTLNATVRRAADGAGRISWFAITGQRPPGSTTKAIWGVVRAVDDGAGLELFLPWADAVPIPMWMSDESGGRTHLNAAWLNYTGRSTADELGFGWLADVHPDDQQRCREVIQQAILARSAFDLEYRLCRADRRYRWMLDHGAPRLYRDGNLAGFTGSCLDIHDRRTAEDHERLLAQVSLLLDAPLALEDRLKQTVWALLPEIADASVVELIAEDGRLQRAAAAHVDSDEKAAVDALPPAHPQGPIAQVAQGGPARLIDTTHDDVPDAALHRLIGARSAAVVPLVARGRRLGALALFTSRFHSDRFLDDDDLRLTERLASRAALAIDNARILQAQRAIAQTLQRALLPEALPHPPWARLSYSYSASGEGVEAGGDFYDAFAVDERRWAVVVGDVCGKGPEAAALTAMARYTIRALAPRSSGPADVLQQLNAAIAHQDPESTRFLTACAMYLTPAHDGVAVTFASAGHPRPVLMRPGNPVEWIDVHGTLIGVFPQILLPETHLHLRVGDRVVLYTDGIVEARRGANALGEDGLTRALTRLAQTASAAVPGAVAAIADEAWGGAARDDVTVVVAEVAHPARDGEGVANGST